MALVSFDDITFSVFTEDGDLPMPVQPANANEPRTYDADIRVQGASDLAALKALRSQVSPLGAMGFVLGGTLVVEAGPGARSLTYPHADSNEATIDAILVGFEPVARMTQDEYRVAVSFICVDV